MQAYRSQLGDLLGDFLFKAFGTMGYRTWDGQIKPAIYDQWNKLRSALTPMANDNAPLSTPNTTPKGNTSGSRGTYYFLTCMLVTIALAITM